jgi:hypothetical protein
MLPLLPLLVVNDDADEWWTKGCWGPKNDCDDCVDDGDGDGEDDVAEKLVGA